MTVNSKKIKRKRGGQKGNQNARKHGFYSSTLSLDEICLFWNLINREKVDAEIAVLRIKLLSSLRHNPGNRRVLIEASRLLANWYSSKYKLSRSARYYLKKIIVYYLEHYTGVSLGRSGQPPKTNNSVETNRAHFKN